VSDEIQPYVVYRIDGDQMECALWQFKDGHKAQAIFLSGDAATSFKGAANLGDEWRIFYPAKEALVQMLKGCHEAGIGYAVLVPDLGGCCSCQSRRSLFQWALGGQGFNHPCQGGCRESRRMVCSKRNRGCVGVRRGPCSNPKTPRHRGVFCLPGPRRRSGHEAILIAVPFFTAFVAAEISPQRRDWLGERKKNVTTTMGTKKLPSERIRDPGGGAGVVEEDCTGISPV
jgi:hypothetical protein